MTLTYLQERAEKGQSVLKWTSAEEEYRTFGTIRRRIGCKSSCNQTALTEEVMFFISFFGILLAYLLALIQ